MKSPSQETSSHSISTSMKKPRKVKRLPNNPPPSGLHRIDLFFFLMHGLKMFYFCPRQVFGWAGQCDLYEHLPWQQGPRWDALHLSHLPVSRGPHSAQSAFLVWSAHPETGGSLGQSVPTQAPSATWIPIQWWDISSSPPGVAGRRTIVCPAVKSQKIKQDILSFFAFVSPTSVYPTPLMSVRYRDSVYRETGHTIMNLLAVSNSSTCSCSQFGAPTVPRLLILPTSHF